MQKNNQAWVKNIWKISMLKLDNFAGFLPEMSASDVEKVRLRLEASKRLICVPPSDEGKPTSDEPESLWVDFVTRPSKTFAPPKDPSAKPVLETESVVFKRLDTICSSIKEACKDALGRSSNSTFVTDPDRTLKSESSWNDSFKVDGHETLDKTTAVVTKKDKKRKDNFRECDVVWLAEFRKLLTPGNVYENACKVIGAACHCLFDDPCRRFIYALTIEDQSAKVWCFTRAAVVVSEPFDFLKDVDFFIRFVASLAISSKEAVGYDPTVGRVLVKGVKQYKSLVGGEYFVTVSNLSNVRSLRVVSRATRVWRVRRWADAEKDEADEFALKDFWIEEGLKSEKETQDAIFAQFNKVNPIDMDLKEAQTYFMDILGDEKVMIGTKSDTTLALPACDSVFSLESPSAVKIGRALQNAPAHNAVVGGVGTIAPYAIVEMKFSLSRRPPKDHRRVLSKEVGGRLDTLRDHQVFFGALMDCVQGLKVLYSAGYVHRDISTSNVLLCSDRAKISDLEYARPFETLAVESQTQLDIPADLEVRTGTPAFMAVEVQSGNYLPYHLPQPNESVNPKSRPKSSPRLTDAVVHNYLHDLESVWWMGNFALFSSVPQRSTQEGQSLHDQQQKVDWLFPHEASLVPSRYNHFEFADFFQQNVEDVLGDDLAPSAMKLNDSRAALKLGYKDFYRDMEAFRTERRFLQVYEDCRNNHREIRASALGAVRWLKDPLPPQPLPVQGIPQDAVQSPEPLHVTSNHNILQQPGGSQKRGFESVEGSNAPPPAKRHSPGPSHRISFKENDASSIRRE